MHKTSPPPDNLPVGASTPIIHPRVRPSTEQLTAFREALALLTDVTAISDDDLRAGAERLLRFVLLVATVTAPADAAPDAVEIRRT